MKKTIWFLCMCLAVLISFYAAVQYFVVGVTYSGFIQMKLSSVSKLSSFWYVMLYIHVASSLITLLIGPFSFSKRLRAKSIRFHKWMGRIYMVAILFGGISGFYLACFANGGIISALGFGTLAVLWLFSGFQALKKIKNKQVQEHRIWMIRNYSLTFGAVTLRLWLILFTLLFGTENMETSYIIISWLSWVPNLILAEIYIRKSK